MNKWYKSCDKLPQNLEQVIIRKGEDTRIATFHGESGKFISVDGGSFEGESIMWMELLRPTDELLYKSYKYVVAPGRFLDFQAFNPDL
jgi:hypothetical protein